jgi:hypothetical protein
MMQRAVGLRESLEEHLQRCGEAVFFLHIYNFANVCFWPKADIGECTANVRFPG